MARHFATARAGCLVFGLMLLAGCGPSSSETTTSNIEPSPPDAASESKVEPPPEVTHADFYTISTYDQSRDPAGDLAKTLERAQAENKRVLLQIGGDWCSWCGLISNYMETNEKVRTHLDQHFLIMKVTYPGDFAEDFLAAYPKCDAYPHFFVLDKNGDFLHSQGTGELEQGKGYDETVFVDFLTKWTP